MSQVITCVKMYLIITVLYNVPNVNLKIMECKKMFYKNKISLYLLITVTVFICM